VNPMAVILGLRQYNVAMNSRLLAITAVLISCCQFSCQWQQGKAAQPAPHIEAIAIPAVSVPADFPAVLSSAVTEDGRIDAEGLKRSLPQLDAQLAAWATVGPTATPERFAGDHDRWAYWYNARIGWALKLAAEMIRADSFDPQYRQTLFALDGRQMSLTMIDRLLVDESGRRGEFRLAACAPGVTCDSAGLPRTPYSAEGFTSALGDSLNRMILDGRRTSVDIENHQVLVPVMLWEVRQQVIDRYAKEFHVTSFKVDLSTALRPLLNPAAARKLDGAMGYTFAPRPPATALAIPKRAIFFPGSVGKIESD
jgi:hypothetical protein